MYSIGLYNGFKGKWSNLSKQEQSNALKKKWYVFWSYRNPATGKLERRQNIHGPTNSFKTYKERMEVLRHLRSELEHTLKNGMNPYNVNKDEVDNNSRTFEAIDYAISIKKNHMKHGSFIRFTSDINKFKEYLKRNNYERRSITSIDKKTVTGYLNEVLQSVSARSRNNYRTNIGSVWQTLKDEGIVTYNFINTIPLLKSKPKRNRTYTDAQVERLFDYMGKNNPNLLLFVKFVSYNFLRPIEVVRLKPDSFDLDKKTVTVFVKNGVYKTKVVPDLLLKDLPPLEGEGWLFCKDEFIGEWDVSEEHRRAYYSGQFREIKKVFDLDVDFSLYGFRHTHISRLYAYFKESGLSKTQIHDKLMNITGHESLKGLQNYLRSIDVDRPEDYSEGLI